MPGNTCTKIKYHFFPLSPRQSYESCKLLQWGFSAPVCSWLWSSVGVSQAHVTNSMFPFAFLSPCSEPVWIACTARGQSGSLSPSLPMCFHVQDRGWCSWGESCAFSLLHSKEMLALEFHRGTGVKRVFGQSFVLCCRNQPEGSSDTTSRNTILDSYFPCSLWEKTKRDTGVLVQ